MIIPHESNLNWMKSFMLTTNDNSGVLGLRLHVVFWCPAIPAKIFQSKGFKTVYTGYSNVDFRPRPRHDKAFLPGVVGLGISNRTSATVSQSPWARPLRF